jgi:CDP-glycerol glycerophosphotransferase
MPRISVLVPIYDVEAYLEECLQSLAAQTVEDFEAVLVDDGSTDASGAMAERFAAQDARFRVLRQANGGLSRARNAGIDAATGEFLAFLDSDDVLPPDAYERLLGALERTGSDFATGNVQRLTATGCSQAPFVAAAFARTRLRTHVRRFPPLLTDRTAWNKLWRRTFWDEHCLRFPEGRLHEDIPVVLPAHFQATRVDVVSAPVYRYRVREHGAPSITQRRHELAALHDRLAAVGQVLDYLRAHEPARQRRRYERTVVAHDLRYHLDLLADADAEYRRVFMEWATPFLAAAGSRLCDGLPAVDRARYALVAQGRLDELLALQRDAAIARRLRRYYAGYGTSSTHRLGRRDQELALTAVLEDVRVEHGRLRLAGHAYVNALGATSPDAQRLEIHAVRSGGRRALRMRLGRRRLATIAARRSDLEPQLRWTGFRASLRPEALPADADARWDLVAYVRAGGLRRRRAVFVLADPALARAVDLPGSPSALVRASVTPAGRVAIAVSTRWVRIEHHRRIGNQLLELGGRARLDPDVSAALELSPSDGGAAVRFPLAVAGSAFRVQVEVGALTESTWELAIVAGERSLPFALAEHLAGAAWRSGGRDMSLERTSDGGGRLVVAAPRVRDPARQERAEAVARR